MRYVHRLLAAVLLLALPACGNDDEEVMIGFSVGVGDVVLVTFRGEAPYRAIISNTGPGVAHVEWPGAEQPIPLAVGGDVQHTMSGKTVTRITCPGPRRATLRARSPHAADVDAFFTPAKKKRR